MFYIAIVNQDDIFNEAHHCRQDINVFQMNIHHVHGKIPYAVISLETVEADKIKENQKVFISARQPNSSAIRHLFSGFIQGNTITEPTNLNDQVVQITLIAESNRCNVKDALGAFKRFPYWDPLFLSKPHQDTIQGMDIWWSKTLPEFKLKEVGKISSIIPIGDQYFNDSVKIFQRCLPWKKIIGRIKAEWVQQFTGIVDISMSLKSVLPEAMISTLTGSDLQRRWWKPQQLVKNSGYKILSSFLEPVQPPETGILNMYPNRSTQFLVNGKETFLPCHWFNPVLVLEWRYQQKRREIIEFIVENGVLGAQGEKTLEWSLQDITEDAITPQWVSRKAYETGTEVQYGTCNYVCRINHAAGESFREHQQMWEPQPLQQSALGHRGRGSFFPLDRGQRAFEHALFQIFCHLQDQQLSMEMQIEMDFWHSFNLEIGEGIELQAPHDPHKKIIGKVLNHHLEINGTTGEQTAHIHIGYCPKNDNNEHSFCGMDFSTFLQVFDKVYYHGFR